MPTHTFPITGPIDLICRFSFGAVVVHAEDNLEEAIVEVTPRDANSDVLARTTVQLRDSTLTVHGPKPRGGLFDLPLFAGSRSRIEDALDVVITVPSATPVRITTLSADVTLHGRVGAADIASGATCVEAEQVDGDLRVRCDSGPIRIGLVTGSAAIRCGSSEVHIGEAGGAFDAAFGTGSLAVATARGSVRLRAGSGSAVIEAAYDDVDLTSGSGGLTIGLRCGQAARLDVVTASGQLHTDMPVEQSRPATGEPLTIRARTGSGDIRIVRAVDGERAAS